MGANCAEDTQLTKKYSNIWTKKKEEMEEKKLTTAWGH